MASLKAIRRRIASVRSTQQITRAMKLVAAARLRRAQDALVAARPYHDALARVAASVLSGETEATAPREEARRAALLVVVASDRGLCGGYNANLLRRAEEEAARVRGDHLEVRLFAVGRKALDYFRRTRAPLAGDRINNTPRLATYTLARDLARQVVNDFRWGEVVEAGMVYSSFRSALSQRPTYERLLPLSPPKPPPGREEEPRVGAAQYLIEPGFGELVPLVTQSYVEAAILHGLLEAEASEHGARMTAMDSATSNAAEMIGRLTLEMNRARQATITRELMDIVGGAEALNA